MAARRRSVVAKRPAVPVRDFAERPNDCRNGDTTQVGVSAVWR